MNQTSYVDQTLSSQTEPGTRRRRRRSRRRSGLASRIVSTVWPAERSLTVRAASWLAIILLISLSFFAARYGLAHLEVLRVENQLRYWQKLGKVPSPASLNTTLAAIERANGLHPDNPYQLTLQARILEWRAYNNGQVIEQDYRQALALYKEATTLRPIWPESWAEMAQVKVRLNEFDAELDQILTKADQLGPYTPAVHLVVAQSNFPRIARLRPEQLSLLQTHTVRGVQDHRSRKQVIALVERYGAEAQACEWWSVANLNITVNTCPE
ncbi:VpsP family polysaccharide biosynthesis protein [Microbulbifer sp. ARAS458-1]|uniref:VpsP family polysaccharide biosynthesis protein n=1 Tax=Microbulbifer sp. ARAS458-1 TaxID=3140242 RepID=UPI0038779204